MKKDFDQLKRLIELDYKRHVKKFEHLEQNKPIVLIGDSMMAYFPVKAFELESSIHNLGIPGDTTIGVLNRIDQVIKLKPKIVILQIGLNDFVLTKLDKEESFENILTIRHQLLENCPDSQVYIFSLTPINQKDFKDQLYLLNRNPNDAKVLNKMLEKVIDEHHFINIYDQLIDENGNLKLSLTRDGIHLNQKGYQVYLNVFQNLIDDTK
jgi:lysophospholipase L1-like esterase